MRALNHGIGGVVFALFVAALIAFRVWPGPNGDPLAALFVIFAVFVLLLLARFVIDRRRV